MSYLLSSGSERHSKSPDTFWIPPESDKAAVQPGDYVKLIFSNEQGAERMWVLVTARDGDSFTGTLANQPYRIAIKHGQRVEFVSDNIIQIIPESEVEE